MHRVLPILLGLGLVGSGCAMAGKSAPRSYRQRSSGPVSESLESTVSVPTLASTGSSSRYRPARAPRDKQASPAPAPPASRRSYRRIRPLKASRSRGSGGSSRGQAPSRVTKAKPVSGTPTSGRSNPTVATGAKVPARLVIYKGTLVLRVFKLSDGVDLAQKLALEAGAYIQSRRGSRMVIRVPVHRFHQLMAQLTAVGEVAGKSIAARDVTRQYFDITHRLKAAHAVLTRLKSLLLKARNVNESLLIEREMSRLLTRIEQYKGLLRYLQHHASLSTIDVHFRVKPRYSRRIRTGWRSPFGWVKGLGLWRMMRH